MSRCVGFCPDCGEATIHRDARRNSESSSLIGQLVHDRLPNTFDFMDIDMLVRKNTTKIMRIVELKGPGQQLKPSQKRIMPLLAIGIDHLKTIGLAHPQSGVYVIWHRVPFEVVTAARVLPRVPYEAVSVDAMAGDTMRQFLSAQEITAVCAVCRSADHDQCDTTVWNDHDQPVPCQCYIENHYGEDQ